MGNFGCHPSILRLNQPQTECRTRDGLRAHCDRNSIPRCASAYVLPSPAMVKLIPQVQQSGRRCYQPFLQHFLRSPCTQNTEVKRGFRYRPSLLCFSYPCRTGRRCSGPPHGSSVGVALPAARSTSNNTGLKPNNNKGTTDLWENLGANKLGCRLRIHAATSRKRSRNRLPVIRGRAART